MQKAYSKINWQNTPSVATPINENNLGAMDDAIDTIDTRVVALDNSKLATTDADTLVQNVFVNGSTGQITVVKKNGVSTQYDLSAVVAAIGLISSDTIEFAPTDYDHYYLDYPENDIHGVTVYTPDFEIEDGSTNSYTFLHFYGNDNSVAISIDGTWYSLYDEDGNIVLDEDLDVNTEYIIKFDTTALCKFQIISTQPAGTEGGITGYVKDASIKVEHLSDEVIDFIKKNSSAVGIADYFIPRDYVLIGFYGTVSEYYDLDLEH